VCVPHYAIPSPFPRVVVISVRRAMSAETPNARYWSRAAHTVRILPFLATVLWSGRSAYRMWLKTRPITGVSNGYVLEAAFWQFEIEVESFKEFTDSGPLVPQRGAYDVQSLGEQECPSSGLTKEMYQWSIRRWDADQPIVTSGRCTTPRGGKFGVDLCDEEAYRHPYWGKSVPKGESDDVREKGRKETYLIQVVRDEDGEVRRSHNVTIVKHGSDSARYLWAHWQRYLGRRVFVEEGKGHDEADWQKKPQRLVGLAEDAGTATLVG